VAPAVLPTLYRPTFAHRVDAALRLPGAPGTGLGCPDRGGGVGVPGQRAFADDPVIALAEDIVPAVSAEPPGGPLTGVPAGEAIGSGALAEARVVTDDHRRRSSRAGRGRPPTEPVTSTLRQRTRFRFK